MNKILSIILFIVLLFGTTTDLYAQSETRNSYFSLWNFIFKTDKNTHPNHNKWRNRHPRDNDDDSDSDSDHNGQQGSKNKWAQCECPEWWPDCPWRTNQEPPPGCNVPEPVGSTLFAIGGIGLVLYRRFRNKN